MNYPATGLQARLFDLLCGFSLVLLAGTAAIALFWAWGGPLSAISIQDDLRRIGLVNSAGEAPTLISISVDPDNRRLLHYDFFAAGIPLEAWEQNRLKIQTILNVTVTDISVGENYRHILVTVVDGNFQLPELLPWNEEYSSKMDGVAVLGEDAGGRTVCLDLRETPHVIFAGATGSGKTVLGQLALHQILNQGGQAAIVDFKGFLDWNGSEFDRCKRIDSLETLLDFLPAIVTEAERRKALLRTVHARNGQEYFEKTGEKLPYFVLVIDEAAEIFSQTGASKAEKERISQITTLLSMFVRQYRAVSISVWLLMQRPDQSVDGGIRSNCTARFLGISDPILARIVLGDEIAGQISTPKIRGRFINQNGETFQAYFYDPDMSLM